MADKRERGIILVEDGRKVITSVDEARARRLLEERRHMPQQSSVSVVEPQAQIPGIRTLTPEESAKLRERCARQFGPRRMTVLEIKGKLGKK